MVNDVIEKVGSILMENKGKKFTVTELSEISGLYYPLVRTILMRLEQDGKIKIEKLGEVNSYTWKNEKTDYYYN
jgi:transcription initiation factor IIE alpha subunit